MKIKPRDIKRYNKIAEKGRKPIMVRVGHKWYTWYEGDPKHGVFLTTQSGRDVEFDFKQIDDIEEGVEKLTKSKLKEMIREEIQNLNEGKKLVNLVNNLEQFIWYKAKNRNVKNKWDDYTDSLMDSEEAQYWADLGSWALQRAYDFGISLLKKNRIKYKK